MAVYKSLAIFFKTIVYPLKLNSFCPSALTILITGLAEVISNHGSY